MEKASDFEILDVNFFQVLSKINQNKRSIRPYKCICFTDSPTFNNWVAQIANILVPIYVYFLFISL